MKFEIGDKVFSSKKEAIEFTRNLIAQLTLSTPIHGDALEFFVNLLDRHPEAEQKIGVGVDFITVDRPAEFPMTKCLFVHRIDGSKTDFSYKACFDGKHNRRSDVSQAFRDAVVDQILAFKNANYKPNQLCPMTQKVLTGSNVHVDHVYPMTFKYLISEFLELRGMTYDDVLITDSTDLQCRAGLADSDFKKVWQEYHATHANLRVISLKANLQLSHMRGELTWHK